jgi:tripartite-type tricarboxylate transporter receptor subunit TctC
MATRLLSLVGLAGMMISPISSPTPIDLPAHPPKAIRIIVPATPGGPPDIAARLIAEKIAAPLRCAVIVENRPGASFTLGLNAVAKAKPDGHTLGVILMTATVSPNLVAEMPYDTERDLAGVSLLAWSYNILAVPVRSPARSLTELLAAAKAKPGALKFSSGGNGTPAHLAGELFKRDAKVDLVHIPYKGAAGGAVALLAADVDMMFGAAGVLTSHIKSGKLRGLATPSPHRLPAYPDLPTLAELGYPRVQIRDWHGVVVPAASPNRVIERLHGEIAKALALPEMKQRLEPLGLDPASMPPADFAVHIREELRNWGKLVRDAGIKPD